MKLWVVLVTTSTWPASPVVSTEISKLEFTSKLTLMCQCLKDEKSWSFQSNKKFRSYIFYRPQQVFGSCTGKYLYSWCAHVVTIIFLIPAWHNNCILVVWSLIFRWLNVLPSWKAKLIPTGGRGPVSEGSDLKITKITAFDPLRGSRDLNV